MPRQKSDHVDSAEALAVRLRAARERAGLSQRQLSAGICTPAYVSRLEKGERIPSLQLLRQLAERMGADADELASGAPQPANALLDAELALRLGATDEAQRVFEDALADPRLRDRALAGLGQLAFQRGEHREAIALLQRAGREDSSSLDTLGRSLALAGELDEATSVFERGLERAEAGDDLADVVRFSVLLANALIDSGTYGRASELLNNTLARMEHSGDPVVLARLWWSQSRLHSSQGNSAKAARYARKALETLDLTEHTVYSARAHQLLAHIELQRGRAKQALELLDTGYPLIEQTGNRFEQATFILERARALLQLDRREESGALAMQASGMLAECAPADAARAYMTVGEVFEELEDFQRARELYELAVETMPPSDRFAVDAYTKLATVLERLGKKDEAFDILKRAVSARPRPR